MLVRIVTRPWSVVVRRAQKKARFRLVLRPPCLIVWPCAPPRYGAGPEEEAVVKQGSALFKLKSGRLGGILGLVCAGLMLTSLAAAQTVTIDPDTGDFIDPPAAEQPARGQVAPLASALSSYHGDLVAVPSPTPGGGLMVDLRGRFQQVMKATIRPDGTPAVHCDSAVGEGR